MLFTTSAVRWRTGSWFSMSCGVSTTATATCGHRSPGSGPFPPSYRFEMTSPWRRSPRDTSRHRPPLRPSSLLHRAPPLPLPPHCLALRPPGPAVVGGTWMWTRWSPRGVGWCRSPEHARPCCSPYYWCALAIRQQPMVRVHLDVAVLGSGRGASSSAPTSGHVHRCCSPLRAVLDPAHSAQPAADLAWGVCNTPVLI